MNNNNPPVSDESGVIKVWQFSQNTDGSLSPTDKTGVATVVKIEDSSGNHLDSDGAGGLKVAVVSGGGSNASVGTTGATAPASATEIGIIDNSGKLQGVSSANPLRIDPTGATPQPISGTISAIDSVVAVNSQTWVTGVGGTSAQINITGYNTVILTLNGSGTITTGAVTFEVSDDSGTTWYTALGRQGDGRTTGSVFTLAASLISYQFNVAGFTTFRARNSTTITGAGGQVIVRAQATTAVFQPVIGVVNESGTNLQVSLIGSGTITLQASQVSAITNTTTTRTLTSTLGMYNSFGVLINITNAGVATGTLQLFLEDSFDGGTTWSDLVASNTFAFGAALTTQRFYLSGLIATTATQGAAQTNETLAAGTVRQGPWGDRIRVREVVSGVSGSPTGVTYTITAIGKL